MVKCARLTRVIKVICHLFFLAWTIIEDAEIIVQMSPWIRPQSLASVGMPRRLRTNPVPPRRILVRQQEPWLSKGPGVLYTTFQLIEAALVQV